MLDRAIFMAIVPPVAMKTTTGLFWATATLLSRQRRARIADFIWAGMRPASEFLEENFTTNVDRLRVIIPKRLLR
jgi:hypothetical protein